MLPTLRLRAVGVIAVASLLASTAVGQLACRTPDDCSAWVVVAPDLALQPSYCATNRTVFPVSGGATVSEVDCRRAATALRGTGTDMPGYVIPLSRHWCWVFTCNFTSDVGVGPFAPFVAALNASLGAGERLPPESLVGGSLVAGMTRADVASGEWCTRTLNCNGRGTAAVTRVNNAAGVSTKGCECRCDGGYFGSSCDGAGGMGSVVNRLALTLRTKTPPNTAGLRLLETNLTAVLPPDVRGDVRLFATGPFESTSENNDEWVGEFAVLSASNNPAAEQQVTLLFLQSSSAAAVRDSVGPAFAELTIPTRQPFNQTFTVNQPFALGSKNLTFQLINSANSELSEFVFRIEGATTPLSTAAFAVGAHSCYATRAFAEGRPACEWSVSCRMPVPRALAGAAEVNVQMPAGLVAIAGTPACVVVTGAQLGIPLGETAGAITASTTFDGFRFTFEARSRKRLRTTYFAAGDFTAIGFQNVETNLNRIGLFIYGTIGIVLILITLCLGCCRGCARADDDDFRRQCAVTVVFTLFIVGTLLTLTVLGFDSAANQQSVKRKGRARIFVDEYRGSLCEQSKLSFLPLRSSVVVSDGTCQRMNAFGVSEVEYYMKARCENDRSLYVEDRVSVGFGLNLADCETAEWQRVDPRQCVSEATVMPDKPALQHQYLRFVCAAESDAESRVQELRALDPTVEPTRWATVTALADNDRYDNDLYDGDDSYGNSTLQYFVGRWRGTDVAFLATSDSSVASPAFSNAAVANATNVVPPGASDVQLARTGVPVGLVIRDGEVPPAYQPASSFEREDDDGAIGRNRRKRSSLDFTVNATAPGAMSHFGALFNNFHDASVADAQEVSLQGRGAIRLEGVRGTHFDLGTFAEAGFTLTFWLKANRDTKGFVYAVVDNWVDEPTGSSPILERLQRVVDNQDLDFFTRHWNVYSALHVDGFSRVMRFLAHAPVNTGNQRVVLRWERDVLANVFDDRWHFLALTSNYGRSNNPEMQLYVDGYTHFTEPRFKQCLRRGETVPEVQPLAHQWQVQVANPTREVVKTDGVAFIGHLNAGMYGFAVHRGPMEYTKITQFATEPLRESAKIWVKTSRAFGGVLMIIALFIVLTSVYVMYDEVCRQQGDQPEEHEPSGSHEEEKHGGQALDEDKKRKNLATRASSSAAKAASAGRQAGKQLIVIGPMFMQVAQNMGMYFQGWQWPFEFEIAFQWIWLPFNLDFNVIPAVPSWATLFAQFAVAAIAMWGLYQFASQDDVTHHVAVIEYFTNNKLTLEDKEDDTLPKPDVEFANSQFPYGAPLEYSVDKRAVRGGDSRGTLHNRLSEMLLTGKGETGYSRIEQGTGLHKDMKLLHKEEMRLWLQGAGEAGPNGTPHFVTAIVDVWLTKREEAKFAEGLHTIEVPAQNAVLCVAFDSQKKPYPALRSKDTPENVVPVSHRQWFLRYRTTGGIELRPSSHRDLCLSFNAAVFRYDSSSRPNASSRHEMVLSPYNLCDFTQSLQLLEEGSTDSGQRFTVTSSALHFRMGQFTPQDNYPLVAVDSSDAATHCCFTPVDREAKPGWYRRFKQPSEVFNPGALRDILVQFLDYDDAELRSSELVENFCIWYESHHHRDDPFWKDIEEWRQRRKSMPFFWKSNSFEDFEAEMQKWDTTPKEAPADAGFCTRLRWKTRTPLSPRARYCLLIHNLSNFMKKWYIVAVKLPGIAKASVEKGLETGKARYLNELRQDPECEDHISNFERLEMDHKLSDLLGRRPWNDRVTKESLTAGVFAHNKETDKTWLITQVNSDGTLNLIDEKQTRQFCQSARDFERTGKRKFRVHQRVKARVVGDDSGWHPGVVKTANGTGSDAEYTVSVDDGKETFKSYNDAQLQPQFVDLACSRVASYVEHHEAGNARIRAVFDRPLDTFLGLDERETKKMQDFLSQRLGIDPKNDDDKAVLGRILLGTDNFETKLPLSSYSSPERIAMINLAEYLVPKKPDNPKSVEAYLYERGTQSLCPIPARYAADAIETELVLALNLEWRVQIESRSWLAGATLVEGYLAEKSDGTFHLLVFRAAESFLEGARDGRSDHDFGSYAKEAPADHLSKPTEYQYHGLPAEYHVKFLPIDVQGQLSRCPTHGTRLMPASEDVHMMVRRANNVSAYSCRQKGNHVFAAFCTEDGTKDRERHNADAFFVCTTDTCDFSICDTCSRMTFLDYYVRTAWAGVYYRIQRANGLTILGLFVIFAVSALYQPVVRTAVMTMFCHTSLSCEYPTCYSPASFFFMLIVFFSTVVMLGMGIGMVLLFWYLLYIRKRKILASGILDGHLKWGDEKHIKGWDPEERGIFATIFADADMQWYEAVLRRDRSMLSGLYEQYEFRWMLIHPWIFVFKATLLMVVLYSGEPNTLPLMAWSALVELMQLFLFTFANPFLDPWLDMLQKAGSVHQIIQLGLMGFYRADIFENPKKVVAGYFMIAVSVVYIAIVILVIAVVVVIPICCSDDAEEKAEEREPAA